jgi:hypothetical protein
LYSPVHKFRHDKPFKQMNVVVIILESFSSEYIFGHKTNDKNIITILQANHDPEETPSEKQLITTIQFYLNRLGYVAGNADGFLARKLEAR